MARIGRNDPCFCGSGKNFKKCCIDAVGKQHNEIYDELEQTLAMIPNLSLDELNLVAERMMNDRNNKPVDDFCGLSPNLMQNWLYAPMNQLQGRTVETPTVFSHCPVVRYLELIINVAMENGGKFKATSKGNLPTFIVKQATEFWSELPTSDYLTHISISEFAGANVSV
ncbi:YecA family protein [Pseudidiomarina sp. WS423]|nr:SEC-C metal-binding domain-containing protein [Pseudidiomarina sp. GXY010]